MPLLDVVLGYDCNAACTYCTITQEMRQRALSTEAVAREIDRASRLGWRDLSFTGGEPTIRDDLAKLVRFARGRGFTTVKVASNGLRYAHAPYLDHLVAAGVNDFHLSAHAPAEAYERVTRLAGSGPIFLRALDNVVARGLDPTLDLIVKEDTYRELPAWIRALHDRGVRRFALWLVSLTDENAPNVEQLPRITNTVPYLAQAFDEGRARGDEVVSLHVPRCLLPGHEADVRHPGADEVRVVTPDEVFELRASRLSGSHKSPACEGCVWNARCPGLRPDYVARHGDGELRTVTSLPGTAGGADPPA